MPLSTTSQLFIEKYMEPMPKDFIWQKTPLQVYRLEEISEYLKLPIPLLTADFHFLVYCDTGKYVHQIGLKKYEIISPSMLHVSEGQAFALHSILEPLSGYFIMLDRRVISSIANKLDLTELISASDFISLDNEQNQWLGKIINLMYLELLEGPADRNIANGLLQALLYKVIKLSGSKKFRGNRQFQIASDFRKLLREEYINHKEVDYYSSKLNVSSNYLSRCVKSTFNKNCKQLIHEVSIMQGQVLMFDSQRDISEISFALGFEDPSYFSRVFKKVTGQTPTEFRSQIMHGLS